MAQLGIKINGDKSLAKRAFETFPSLNQFLGTVAWSSYNYTGAPTAGQKKKLATANKMYKGIHEQVKSIGTKTQELQSKLEALGAPYLEDSLPE